MINGSITWVGANGKRSKLERALCNMDWVSLGSWQATLLPRKGSDHRGILISAKDLNWGPKPFRFYNTWLKSQSWRIYLNHVLEKELSKPGTDIQQIIRKIKVATKSWEEKEGNLVHKIQKLEELLAYKEEHGGLPGEIQGIEMELEDLKKVYDSMLLQKSRISWLKEGDRNSRFFHQAILRRRTRNKISHPESNGQVVNSVDGIKNILKNHISNLFSERNDVGLFKIPQGFFKSLSEKDMVDLDRDISLDEILLALKQSSDNKALVPNGINFGVIKEVWKEIQDKVMEFIKEFEISGTLPKGMNSSFITLVPKVHNPKSVKDYRPISLINCSMKLLSKLLANRLSRVIGSLVSPVQTC